MCHVHALGSQARGTQSLPALATPMPLTAMGASAQFLGKGDERSPTHSLTVTLTPTRTLLKANPPSPAPCRAHALTALGTAQHHRPKRPAQRQQTQTAKPRQRKATRTTSAQAHRRSSAPASTLLLPRTNHSIKHHQELHANTHQPPVHLQTVPPTAHSLPWQRRQPAARAAQWKHTNRRSACRAHVHLGTHCPGKGAARDQLFSANTNTNTPNTPRCSSCERSSRAPSPPATGALPAQHLLPLDPLTGSPNNGFPQDHRENQDSPHTHLNHHQTIHGDFPKPMQNGTQRQPWAWCCGQG